MTNDEINNIIVYWLLSDNKYRAHSKEIMNIIKNKNVSGITIEEVLAKKMNLSRYLYGLLDEYLEQDMIDRIANKLNVHKISNMDSHDIAKLVCNFLIDEIQQHYVVEKKWFDKFKYVETNFVGSMNNDVFAETLQKVSGINVQDAIQIKKFLMKYYIQHSNDEIEVMIINMMKKKFKRYINSEFCETIEFWFETFKIDYQTF
eukprot:494642_1